MNIIKQKFNNLITFYKFNFFFLTVNTVNVFFKFLLTLKSFKRHDNLSWIYVLKRYCVQMSHFLYKMLGSFYYVEIYYNVVIAFIFEIKNVNRL